MEQALTSHTEHPLTQSLSPKTILLLWGGTSAERDVSYTSHFDIEKALRSVYQHVYTYDVTDDMDALIQTIQELKPDAIFNGLYGTKGEDGVIQRVLDTLHIPYTHCGPHTSARAMDKSIAQKIFKNIGLTTISTREVLRCNLTRDAHSYRVHPDITESFDDQPIVIKPVADGSSRGVFIIKDGLIPQDILDPAWPYGDPVLVQKYIKGREIFVAVAGEEGVPLTHLPALGSADTDVIALGAIEVVPNPDKVSFYDYTAKYTDGVTEHIMPAPLDAFAYKRVLNMAKQAHIALGCRGVTRTDFLYDGQDFYILELNTQPGLTPLSLVPEIAAHRGIDFVSLIQYLIHAARFGD